jgi:plastocyanin
VGTSAITSGTSDKELIIQNYGTGAGTALAVGAAITNNGASAIGLTVSGPGETILSGTNTYSGGTVLNGPGTVNFTNGAAFGSAGTGITFNGATLQYATGTTVDFTAAGTTHAMTFNASGGTIDTNGTKQTYTGASFGTGIGGLTVTDATGTGSLQINGTTGYTGNTTVRNGGDLILGSSGILGGSQNAGTALTIVGNGGTLQGGSTTLAGLGAGGNYGSSKAGVILLQSGGVLEPGAGIGTQVIQNTGSGTLGNGSVSSNVQLNVLTATSLTFNPGGTIKFELDSVDPATEGTNPGTALNPYASTQLNLGQGALVKGNTGVGQFVLDFGNTGTYDPSNMFLSGDPSGYQNVYDLINFGGTSLTGGLDGNTNFNIDDFTIKNLAGIGTLSFWYNNTTNQEELLLTVVPEPSTWAMLIGGLATLIFWTRKRAARRTVVACNK